MLDAKRVELSPILPKAGMIQDVQFSRSCKKVYSSVPGSGHPIRTTEEDMGLAFLYTLLALHSYVRTVFAPQASAESRVSCGFLISQTDLVPTFLLKMVV